MRGLEYWLSFTLTNPWTGFVLFSFIRYTMKEMLGYSPSGQFLIGWLCACYLTDLDVCIEQYKVLKIHQYSSHSSNKKQIHVLTLQSNIKPYFYLFYFKSCTFIEHLCRYRVVTLDSLKQGSPNPHHGPVLVWSEAC